MKSTGVSVWDVLLITSVICLGSAIVASAVFIFTPDVTLASEGQRKLPRNSVLAEKPALLSDENNSITTQVRITGHNDDHELIKLPAKTKASLPDWYADPEDPAYANMSIAGNIVDDDGQPISDVSIDIWPTMSSKKAVTVNSDADGRFKLEGLVAGEYRLRTHGHAQYDNYYGRAHAGNNSLSIVLAGLNSVNVRGYVQDQHSLPVSGVQVISPGIDNNLQTGDNGEFNQAVKVTDGSALSLKFRRDGYQSHTTLINTELLEAGEVIELAITLQRGSVTVTGQVVDNLEAPVKNADISLYSASTKAIANGSSDEEGYFLIKNLLPANDYSMSVHSAGFQSRELQNQSIQTGQPAIKLRLQRHAYASFNGRVTDNHGNGLVNLKLLVKTHGVGGSQAVATTSNGEFTMPKIAAGAVLVYTSGEPWVRAGPFELAPGQSLFQELSVDLGSQWLFGTVTDAYNEPLRGARVTMHVFNQSDIDGTQSNSHRDTSTDNNGEFEFTQLGSGTRSLTVSAPGFSSQSINVNPGEQAGPHLIVLSRAGSG